MMNYVTSIIFLLTISKMVECYFKCTTDGFFADKSDCWVYHICDGGTHSVRACEEDLFFNPKTGLCDWPMNVDCKQPAKQANKVTTSPKHNKTSVKAKTSTSAPLTASLSISSSESSSSSSSSGDSSSSSNSSDNSLLENMCSSEDYGYMSHPKDCRKYIYCQEGTAKVFTCQGGLLWKQSDGNCVWPLDSDCPSLQVKKTTLSSSNNLNQLSGTGGGLSLPNPQNPTQVAALLKEIYGSIECPIEATGFFPNPYDCSAYHFCNTGKDQVILCEPGLTYRHDKQVCDWPVNSNCSPKCPSNMEKYRFIDPKSCCRYYECVNGRLVIQLCQYPLLFDVQTKQCLDYSKVKCGIRKDCTSPCQYFTNEDPSICEMVPNCNGKPHGVYLDQNRPNCQFFYTCRDNRVFNHTRCSGALRFNQFEGRCMPPNLVTCSSAYSIHLYKLTIINTFHILCFLIFVSILKN